MCVFVADGLFAHSDAPCDAAEWKEMYRDLCTGASRKDIVKTHGSLAGGQLLRHFALGIPTYSMILGAAFASNTNVLLPKVRTLDQSSVAMHDMRWWKTADTDPALIPGGFSEEPQTFTPCIYFCSVRAVLPRTVADNRGRRTSDVGIQFGAHICREAVFASSAERKFEYSYLKGRALD